MVQSVSGCLLFCLVCLSSGCSSWTLKEVRGKTKAGPEFRTKSRTHETRYTVQQALDFKWDNGWSTVVTYRRRDTDDGGKGEHDNGIWLEMSYPLWKRPAKPDAKTAEIESLRRRLARLETDYAKLATGTGEGSAQALAQTH